jgi:hypothetical protein
MWQRNEMQAYAHFANRIELLMHPNHLFSQVLHPGQDYGRPTTLLIV